MKVANIMNFVRYIDERDNNSIEKQYEVTRKELELVNDLELENTFLLQYDALCDERYQKLFKENATPKTELGLWFEVVEPLTSACNMPYRSEKGWKWDWHIIPGFSMGYTPEEREALIDEAMRKFKEIFGYYPKTFASWIFDTHTMNYLVENYEISAFAICRDQISTDAYTLIGGYFNQAYYPSKNNIFTPAKTDELRVNTPVFRLLGACPIHNYEGNKYISSDYAENFPVYTLEPVSPLGNSIENSKKLLDYFYKNESLAFAYAQLGQENSMGERIIEPLRQQLTELALYNDVEFMKMCDVGEMFKKRFPNKTPATSVVALENWDSEDIQSVYYDCENYTANIIRFEDRISIRSLFLFDERVKDKYLTEICTTFDAVYENLPIVDTLRNSGNEKYCAGIVIDTDAVPFNVEKISDTSLKVSWGDKAVVFDEDVITVYAEKLCFYTGEPVAVTNISGDRILFDYKDNKYFLRIKNADIIKKDNNIHIIPENGMCKFYPEC